MYGIDVSGAIGMSVMALALAFVRPIARFWREALMDAAHLASLEETSPARQTDDTGPKPAAEIR